MSELDVLLRESLGRLAEPGDPTGVADAVRARVGAAGAGGEAPPGAGPAGGGGSSAAGAGGGAGAAGTGFWGGWAPLGILIGLSVAGGVGLALAQGVDPLAAESMEPVSIQLPATVGGASCPGGPATAQLDGGARVLALYRSEDGAFLAVRNPSLLGQTVWIPASSAIVDEGQDVDALPVDGCREGGVIVAAPEPEAVPTETAPLPEDTTDPKPKPQPDPEPAPDTTPPSVNIASGWSEPFLCAQSSAYGPYSASISINASDNSGSVSVSGASTTAGVNVSGPSGSGSTKTFTITYTGTAYNVPVTVKFTATDPSGKTAQVQSPSLTVYDECIG